MTQATYPKNVTKVSTYAELRRWGRAFATGALSCLLLLGRPGTGKTWTFRRLTEGNSQWIVGHSSAFGLYCDAYEHRDRPLVLDDVDSIIQQREFIPLFKALGQSESTKHLSWNSASPALSHRGVPTAFMTSSRVAIIANDWRGLTADVQAIEDRAHVVVFDPSAEEVHRAAATWFDDPAVFEFIGQHLGLFLNHSCRTYIQAAERRSGGLDWRSGILDRCLSGVRLEVARVMAEPGLGNVEARAEAFKARTGKSRATFFNHRRRLRELARPLDIVLQSTVAPEVNWRPRRAILRPLRQGDHRR